MRDNPAPRHEELPSGQVRVLFSAPIVHFSEAKGSVTLRPPNVSEIWEIGDPRSFIFNDAGLSTPYTDREKLRQWIGRLMVDHDSDIIGREADPALGMLIEEVVLGFFSSARKRLTNASAPSSQAA